jgi:hypothetical protein
MITHMAPLQWGKGSDLNIDFKKYVKGQGVICSLLTTRETARSFWSLERTGRRVDFFHQRDQ